MRVLCTTLPEYGHFHPMAPLAAALAAAGHQVAFATAGEFCPRVEAAGFDAFPAGLGHFEQVEEARRRFPADDALPGPERFLAFVPKMLAEVAAPARLDDLVPIVAEWQPDILIHDEVDFAGPIAAALADIPYVGHGVGVLRPLEALQLSADLLAPLYRQRGVELGPFGGIFDYLYFDVCPPSLQPRHARDIPVLRLIRASSFDAAGEETLPSWVGELPDSPTVYVTLGTIFNRTPGLFGAILAALHGEPVNVVVTVGYDTDPASLGPQPDNVHIERYIPQSDLLPYCDLVVAQGGWSVVSVLSQGLPLLLLPQGANQFWHTEFCVAAGAARRLLPAEITPAAVRSEVRALLAGAEYREGAGRVRDEIEAMPTPEQSVALVEQVQREGQPLTGAPLSAS